MIHLDLFSGIGGFALAADSVWENIEHIFCEIDLFCQQVLKKHYPNSKIYGDIREITADTTNSRIEKVRGWQNEIFLLTGGFPCQPFSHAGKRKGTEDNRHLWPEMFRVIQLTKPQWVIAENVRGLLTIGQGLVFEQACIDLESAGYQVQPFIIPAVAVNAPHRRDRVWIIANRNNAGSGASESGDKQSWEESSEERQHPSCGCCGQDSNATNARQQREGSAKVRFSNRRESSDEKRIGATERDGLTNKNSDATDTASERREGDRLQRKRRPGQLGRDRKNETQSQRITQSEWDQNWIEVAAKLCGVDDGLSVELGEFKLTKSQHRKEQLKAYGNAIVPQVAVEIMKAINLIT